MGEQAGAGETAAADAREAGFPAATVGTAYEILWAEYSAPPKYVNEEMSPELVWLMFQKRKERIDRMNAEIEKLRRQEAGEPLSQGRVSDVQFFKNLPRGTGIKIGRA